MRFTLLALAVALACGGTAAQTTGLIPLNDLGQGVYQGFQGGLYPAGANVLPETHRAMALQMASQIVPLDAAGLPVANGWIVMVAIGMSNTTHEFAVFERSEDTSVDRNARVVLMDTALGGQAASIIASPDAAYWSVVVQRLISMGLTPEQVQVAWLKEANANPPDDFPIHAREFRDDLKRIANNLRDRFPNLRLCYVSSRTYGGYATTSLNPEPQAYESGFSVKWLIEDQINGDPALNYGQLAGEVRSPLLLWGPYLWADGTNPRSDGLVWLQTDFEGDGTHPSPAGEQKVAGLLSAHFPNDITARAWWPRVGDDAVLLSSDATKDATVEESNPNMNFGQALQLVASGGTPASRIYTSFDIGATGPWIALAKLSLRVASSGGGSVFEVANTAWDETTITFNNKPDVGPLIVELPTSSRDGTIAADVTAALQSDADGTVGFALGQSGSGQKSYTSRESAQPPRLVLVAPCAGWPDSDGDGRSDPCDCAPADSTLFGKPAEVVQLRWSDKFNMAWNSAAASGGSSTVYDVMSGDLAEVASYGTGLADTCIADDEAALSLADPAPDPPSGGTRFFLVRAQNACSSGRYQTATSGRDRATTACP